MKWLSLLKKKKTPRITVTVVTNIQKLIWLEEGPAGAANSMNQNIDCLTTSLFPSRQQSQMKYV